MNKIAQDQLTEAAEWIEEGKLKPYINEVVKLEEVQNMLEEMKKGKG